MSRCRRPRRNHRLVRKVLAAVVPLPGSLEASWWDIAATCVWWCPGKRFVVLAFRWRSEAIWKCSATRSAKVRHRRKGSLLSSETAFAGWALWRPATQALRDVKSWQTKLEATPRSSAVMRKLLGEAVVFRIQDRTRSVPLRLL